MCTTDLPGHGHGVGAGHVALDLGAGDQAPGARARHARVARGHERHVGLIVAFMELAT